MDGFPLDSPAAVRTRDLYEMSVDAKPMADGKRADIQVSYVSF